MAGGKKRKWRSANGPAAGLTMSTALALTTDHQDDTGHPPQSNGGPQHSPDQKELNGKARRKLKKLADNQPAFTLAGTTQAQVALSDIQSLILYILADGPGPKWIAVRNHQNFDKVVVLMAAGLGQDLFTGQVPLAEENGDKEGNQGLKMTPPNPGRYQLNPKLVPEPLLPLCGIFKWIWPVKAPGDFKRLHSPITAILSSPIPQTREEKMIKGAKPPAERRYWENTRTPITEFILSRSQLLDNTYALHPALLSTDLERDSERARRYKTVQTIEDGWVDLPDMNSLAEGAVPDREIESGSILQGRTLLVIDCEMVESTAEQNDLARVSIVNWDGELVLDELVKPVAPIRDYRTQFSGITAEMLSTTTTTLPDIQEKLKTILTPHTILAGHSLDSDLRALKLSFPFIVDSTLLYPHPKGPPFKSSLKWLAQKYLSRDIQTSRTDGHDSVEDCKACLDLIKQKCERGKNWGTADATSEPIFKRLARRGLWHPRFGTAPPADETRRTGAVVDRPTASHGFAASATLHLPSADDQEVANNVLRAVKEVDFTFGRLRELEFARGWAPHDAPSDEGQTPEPLVETVKRTVQRITEVHAGLPPRTALIVLSGSGNPLEMKRMQKMYEEHREEFKVKKWDELSVKWTDVEEMALNSAVNIARMGVGFLAAT